jgi:hypothetical protein
MGHASADPGGPAALTAMNRLTNRRLRPTVAEALTSTSVVAVCPLVLQPLQQLALGELINSVLSRHKTRVQKGTSTAMIRRLPEPTLYFDSLVARSPVMTNTTRRGALGVLRPTRRPHSQLIELATCDIIGPNPRKFRARIFSDRLGTVRRVDFEALPRWHRG